MTKYGLVRLGCAVALLAAACGSESDGVSELTLRADGHEVLLSGVSPVDVGSDASSAGSAFDSPYAWQLDVVANDLAPVPVTAVSEAANATRRISEVCVDGVSGRIALQVGGASSVTLWVPFGAPDFDEAVQLSLTAAPGWDRDELLAHVEEMVSDTPGQVSGSLLACSGSDDAIDTVAAAVDAWLSRPQQPALDESVSGGRYAIDWVYKDVRVEGVFGLSDETMIVVTQVIAMLDVRDGSTLWVAEPLVRRYPRPSVGIDGDDLYVFSSGEALLRLDRHTGELLEDLGRPIDRPESVDWVAPLVESGSDQIVAGEGFVVARSASGELIWESSDEESFRDTGTGATAPMRIGDSWVIATRGQALFAVSVLGVDRL